ncbi:MAG: type II toxin-antitoxin system RelE/ParE family toxin [Blastocatellia bacterium]
MNGKVQTLYNFVETAIFSRQLDRLASLDTLYDIQSDLIADPERWPIVKGINGARKGRVADSTQAKGKSGGFRYLYLYLELRGRIHLLFLFDKKDQADLSDEQKKTIASLVETLKKSAR